MLTFGLFEVTCRVVETNVSPVSLRVGCRRIEHLVSLSFESLGRRIESGIVEVRVAPHRSCYVDFHMRSLQN